MRVTPEIPTLRSPTAKAARDTPGVLPGGPNPERLFGGINGRRERIGTSGPYVPNVVLYQAELLSDYAGRPSQPVSRERPYSDAPWAPQPTKSASISGHSRGAFRHFRRVESPSPPLYGPGLTTALGRRQVVRHWILIPAFEGSIPSAPASQSLLCRGSAKTRISPRTSGRLARF